MEKTISKADRDSIVRFAEIYTTLSAESKKLVFAFAQGMETQRLISQDKLVSRQPDHRQRLTRAAEPPPTMHLDNQDKPEKGGEQDEQGKNIQKRQKNH